MNFYLRWLEEMAKLRGLGKGLDALLSAANVSAAATPTAGKVKVSTHAASDEAINELALKDILLEKISPGKYQPRRIFAEAELQELADSIRHNGVIQPIVVRKIGSNYE
ncbi:MAG: ParB N-terminal domain-containing protein, partial [Burkholderiales bacterium]